MDNRQWTIGVEITRMTTNQRPMTTKLKHENTNLLGSNERETWNPSLET